MAGQDSGGLPQVAPQDARRQAEELLGPHSSASTVPRAAAFALLAVAGELHAIRRLLEKRR